MIHCAKCTLEVFESKTLNCEHCGSVICSDCRLELRTGKKEIEVGCPVCKGVIGWMTPVELARAS